MKILKKQISLLMDWSYTMGRNDVFAKQYKRDKELILKNMKVAFDD